MPRHGRRLQDHYDSLGRVKKRSCRRKNHSEYNFMGSLHPDAARNIDNIIELTL